MNTGRGVARGGGRKPADQRAQRGPRRSFDLQGCHGVREVRDCHGLSGREKVCQGCHGDVRDKPKCHGEKNFSPEYDFSFPFLKSFPVQRFSEMPFLSMYITPAADFSGRVDIKYFQNSFE